MGEKEFREVAEGVYTCDHAVVEGKNTVVFGDRTAVAVDTGIEPEDGQAMAEFIRSRGFEVKKLVLTHGHGDHIFGSGAFRGGEVYASILCPDVMREQIPKWKARCGGGPSDPSREWAWPTVTFTDRLILDIGGMSLELFATPGHSRDSICVHIPQRKLLVGGDTVVTAILPAIFHDSRRLQESLREIQKRPAEILIPGHGEALQGRERIHGWLDKMTGYITSVRKRICQEVTAGKPPREIPASVPLNELLPSELDREKYGMERRHRMVVEKLVIEETGAQSC